MTYRMAGPLTAPLLVGAMFLYRRGRAACLARLRRQVLILAWVYAVVCVTALQYLVVRLAWVCAIGPDRGEVLYWKTLVLGCQLMGCHD